MEVTTDGPAGTVESARALSSQDQYPVSSEQAGTVGVDVTLYAVLMRAGGRVVGAFSLYVAIDPQARSAEDPQFLAAALGAFLQGDIEPLDSSEKAVFHQSVGMVVAQLGVGPEAAGPEAEQISLGAASVPQGNRYRRPMTFGQVFAIVWGVGAIAMGLHGALNSESYARAVLERQGGDPDAPKSQWMYPFVRALSWILAVAGLTAGVLGMVGVLS
jgi:hypothetical protein